MNANEVWRPTYVDPKYEVSNLGRVRNKETGHIKSARTTKTGYKTTDLKNRGKKTTAYIHRLVAVAFVENPDGLPFINHKDENKTNNCADNLEWCTASYNNHYGKHIERMTRTKREMYGKRIRQIDPINGSVVATYISMTEAAEVLKITRQAIMWGLLKPHHTACGYRWEVCE